jgi:CRP/FNR family transcriptional regulator, cyclic AMP receptor protein
MKLHIGSPPKSLAMRTSPYGFELFDDCLTCKWRGEGFFCNLEPDALKAFDAITFTNVYPEGAVLYSEGQAPRGGFEICHGSAKLSISSADGRTLITKIVGAGEVLGLSSSMSGNPYKSTAETLEPSQVNFVRRDDLLRFIDKHRQACTNVARALTRECEADADHIRSLELSHTATEKLANLILSWCAADGKRCEPGCRVQMLMTHEDMSQLIGTSRETVTRLLKEFREKKLVTIKGSTLIIHDRSALESLVQL